MASVSILERFNAKAVRSPDPDACWDWVGCVCSKGYPRLAGSVSGRRTDRAYQVSYLLFVGAIPDGLEVRHSCDNRRCTNPRHLSVGTHAENMRDMVTRGRGYLKPGAGHPAIRLSDADVSAIKDAPDDVTNTALARRFGVSQGHVSKIRHGLRRTPE